MESWAQSRITTVEAMTIATKEEKLEMTEKEKVQ